MPWLQLIFETPLDDAQPLADLLSEHEAAAVTLQDGADQPLYEPPPGATPLWKSTRVIGLYPAEIDAEALLEALTAAWSPKSLPQWRLSPLEDKDWSRAWMDNFHPLRFGERLWIVPSWHEPPQAEGVNILLDPGLAFGTGTHATTRLCLEWLDAHPPQGAEVIDYGCGSGILALGAAKLGAKWVRCIDNDPQALQATGENARRNGCETQLTTYLPDDLPAEPVDLLLANILAGPLVELAPRLTDLVRSGGHIVLSGILTEQAGLVSDAYRETFEMGKIAEHEGWVRLEGRRK